ncbi:unnamed protein product [Linum trigynum]|uniref:RNase H type-1 domain-containing protein n=1 Tax=Linum trigynum TaxID=586398 RepID=A0AAV2EYC1_9ROSI
MGMQNVVFAEDAQVVLDKVKEGWYSDARGGAILSEIKLLRQCFHQFSVCFVGRVHNRAARIMVKKTLLLFPSLIEFDFRYWLWSTN